MIASQLEIPPQTGVAMQALVYQGPGKPSWESHAKPTLRDPQDAIVRITTSTTAERTCTSSKETSRRVTEGRILGHEGVFEEVGTAVSAFRPGDRVLISASLVYRFIK
jgi:alcohol dehydrogenase